MSNRTYQSLPKTYKTYGKIFKSLIPVISDKPKGSKNSLPEATYRLEDFKVDKTNLQDYRRICGFANNGLVPPTYFAVLSLTLQMNMMVDEPFAFPMPGLVHINNSVTQYRHIADSETVSLEVSFANLRDHEKGQQFDFVTKVYNQSELIWEGVSTYLSRQKSKTSSKAKTPKTLMPKPTIEASDLHHVFAVPEDIGRRYAMVSGDFNLIHLHPLTAKVLGFPNAIAHGMWSKAKCLSLMDLPEAFCADVAFKLPIYLPSEVELIGNDMRQLSDSEEVTFDLYSAKNNKPHLAGVIKAVKKADQDV